VWKVSTVPPSFLMGHRQSFSASILELPQPRVDDMKHLFYSISWGINKLHLLPKVHSTCFGTAVMTSHKNGVPMGFLYIYIHCMYIYIYSDKPSSKCSWSARHRARSTLFEGMPWFGWPMTVHRCTNLCMCVCMCDMQLLSWKLGFSGKNIMGLNGI